MNTRTRIVKWAPVMGALAIGLASNAFGQNPPPVIADTYDINKQVDAVRYVERAVLTNNKYGDFILEFDAERTDLEDTRERWTLTYVNDPNFDWVATLEVNGVHSYTLTLDDWDTNPVLSIAVGGQSAEIDVVNPCADTDFDAYKNLLASSAGDRAVVAAVLAEIQVEQPDVDPISPETQDCHDDCSQQYDYDCDSATTCDEEFLCCLYQKHEWWCIWNCNCEHEQNNDPGCYAVGLWMLADWVTDCVEDYNMCVIEQECP